MTGNRLINRLSIGLVGLLLCWAPIVQAAVPEQISYQGRLTDATNIALEGAYLMVFSLWDVDTGGVAALWFEQQTVNVTEGIYNVQLGAVVPFPADLLDGPDRFIQVEIFTTGEGWEVLTPRQPLTSVPFAMHAAQADSTIDGAITASMLATQAVTTEKLEDGAVTAAKVTGGFVPDLDADKLDGLDATAFSPLVHNHDGSYYSQAHVDALEDRIAALEAKLQYLTVVAGTVNEMPGPHVMITGANLHVTSGSGSTDGPINGLGNLIVGYNELQGSGDDRTGSHTIVVGREHNFSSYGGLVGGYQNTISGPYASVSGGNSNTASAYSSSVSGGRYNTASGWYSSVSGGNGNTASGNISSVSGGNGNTASGGSSSVSGGEANAASANVSSVSGGYGNKASGSSASVSGGFENTASGSSSSVSGGNENEASGDYTSVSGGRYNTARGYSASVSGGGGEIASDGNDAFADYSAILGGRGNNTGDNLSGDHTIGSNSTVSGGAHNTASDWWSSVSGGYANTAGGNASSVSGGLDNTASSPYAIVSGGYANTASGYFSSVSGGYFRSVSGHYDWRAGDYFQDQ